MTTSHVPAAVLDALATDSACAPEEAQRARAHLDACAQCRAEYAVLAAAVGRFRTAGLPRSLDRLEHRRRRATWFGAFGALSVAASIAILVRVPAANVVPKGAPTLVLIAVEGAREQPLREGDVVPIGAGVRAIVLAPHEAHAAVASVDERGVVSVYGYAVRGSDGRFELPGVVRLDETGGRECFHAFVSADPIADDAIRAALAPGRAPPEAMVAMLCVAREGPLP